MATAQKTNRRQKLRWRIRTRIVGTAQKPRLSVFRSSKQIYAQVIDDGRGHTLASASTLEKDLRGSLKTGATVEAAREIGRLLAERAKGAGVSQVVFDRSGYLYHGRVKALAEAARAGGLDV